jgi:hypothetical protein
MSFPTPGSQSAHDSLAKGRKERNFLEDAHPVGKNLEPEFLDGSSGSV